MESKSSPMCRNEIAIVLRPPAWETSAMSKILSVFPAATYDDGFHEGCDYASAELIEALDQDGDKRFHEGYLDGLLVTLQDYQRKLLKN
jgi:hypothetical protein